MLKSIICFSYCVLFLLCLQPLHIYSQCLTYPVELEDREQEAEFILLGKLISKQSYWDAEHRNIYTLNLMEVTAWLKGYSSDTQVGVITVGGTVGEWSQVSQPSLQIDPWNEYVLFLAADNPLIDDKSVRSILPGLIQALPVADVQGAITKQAGVFHDLHFDTRDTEAKLLSRIQALTGEEARTPDGRPFEARSGDTWPLAAWSEQASQQRSAPITSFSPSPTNAGTINPADFLTINGSGFGGAAGTVFYSNADDGGATFTASGVATDNISWNDSQVQNKPARRAGNGPINVNGAITSATSLIIDYAHIDINSSFASHGSSTRQGYRHVDKNGSGGYTFAYNTGFAANTAAVAAFTRALDTWRCETFINFQISPTNTAVAAVGLDGTNCIFFNAALPSGVLGRANSMFQGSATGACNLFNTVWWVDEIDLEFRPDPPAGCCTWNFGPASSAFLEFDFESVVLHELGHAHGLGHVIDPGKVMHFALANGVDSRSLATGDIDGGNAKMTFNAIPLCFNPATVNGNMVPSEPATCQALPVNFLHFSANRLSSMEVGLRWEVSEGLDGSGFEVQRSLDAKAFQTIGLVNHDGGSPVGKVFQFKDQEASSSLAWYYRLQNRDRNGQVSSSEIVQVAAIDGPSLEIFPTVTHHAIQLRGRSEQGARLTFALSDMAGKTVQEKSFSVNGGNFSYELSLENLPNGIYLYQASIGNIWDTGKIIVAR